jgi:F-type H+-transporting ATPase subunit epsilon
MTLDIITPDKTIYSGNIEMLRVPGTKGLFQILNNHAPIISTLDKGIIKVRDNKQTELEFDINKGYIKCINNMITILIQE